MKKASSCPKRHILGGKSTKTEVVRSKGQIANADQFFVKAAGSSSVRWTVWPCLSSLTGGKTEE